MIKTFPVEVGQTVYIGVSDGRSFSMPDREMFVGQVVKIGRQYLYVKCPDLEPLRVSKDTFSSAPSAVKPYNGKYILFESEDDFREDAKCMEYRKAIASCLSGSFGNIVRTLDVSLDALKKIYEILKAEGVPRLGLVTDKEEKHEVRHRKS